jgi:hypothetical protein
LGSDSGKPVIQPSITFKVAVSSVPSANITTVSVTVSGFEDLANMTGNLKGKLGVGFG